MRILQADESFDAVCHSLFIQISLSGRRRSIQAVRSMLLRLFPLRNSSSRSGQYIVELGGP